jgi:predicted aconitase with swiveling domain
MSEFEFAARALVEGEAEGPVVALSAPLSLWGGLDAATGRIVDRSHPDLGREVRGAVLVMPSGRGSSSSSSVLAEALRRGTGPLAVVLVEPDPILAVGAIVAARLYGTACPIVACAAGDHARIAAAPRVLVLAGEGTALVRVEGPDAPGA